MKYNTPILLMVTGFIVFLFSNCDTKPSIELEAKYEQARLYYNQRLLGKAEKILREVLQKKPSFIQAQLMLGRLYFYEQRFKLAETVFLEANNLDESNLTAKYYLALAYVQNTKRQTEALRLLNLITDKNQNFLQAWQLKGQIYEHRGDLRNAIQSYRRAILESRIIEISHRKLGNLYQKVEIQDKARMYLKSAECFTQTPDEPVKDFNHEKITLK